jgi:hypothetical protein
VRAHAPRRLVAESLHFRVPSRGSLERMEEAHAVLERLDRIERLECEGAPPAVLLEELRALVREAERWVKREGTGGERAALLLERCHRALARGRVPLVAR